jgi:exopolysaccharide biosynthesis WecB/TagA/CpsF family protein
MLYADQAGAPAHGGSSIAPGRTRALFAIDDYELPEFLPVAAQFGINKYGYVLTPNIDGFIRLQESATCRAAYAQAAYVLLDSRVAGFLFRLVHRLRVPVCPGSDLTAGLLNQVIKPDDRVIVIGSTEGQAQILRDRFGLEHLLHYNPPMGFIRDPAAVEACLQFIESASPFHYCLIAVGDPQGFMVAHRLAERERARGLAFIIGASIDFITGHQQRAPAWMQRVGLEWLYRLSRNPRRLAWRYLVRGPKFFVYLFMSRVVLRPAHTQAVSEA